MLRSTAFLMAFAVSIHGGPLFAQEDFDVFDSENIDVDGLYREKPEPTAADRTRQRIKKLKKRINDKVDNTIENMRLKQEKEMGQQLENMFQGKKTEGGNAYDDGGSTGTAPTPPQRRRSRIGKMVEGDVSLFIWGGESILNLSGKGGLGDRRYSTNNSFRVELAGEVSPRADVGVSVGYGTLEFKGNPYSFDRNHYHSYSDHRDIVGNLLSADLRGRYYFSRIQNRVRPFLSGFIGFNRLDLNYSMGRAPYSWGSPPYDQYGREAYNSSFMSGGFGAGLKIDFSESFGLMANGEFAKNFGGSDYDGNFYQTYNAYRYINEQMVLEDLASELRETSRWDISLGVRIAF